MPLHFSQFDRKARQEVSKVGITNDEILDLISAFRLYGFFRIDLDTGHLFATPDVYEIFGMAYHDGPLNMVEFGQHIHPDDLPLVMEALERASTHKETFHVIYRVRRRDGAYYFVRTVGKFRDKEAAAGEIVGVTYEFFERVRTVGFCGAED